MKNKLLLVLALLAAGTNLFGGAASGGGGVPAGATTQVQYNNAGAFGGNAAFTFNATNGRLTVPEFFTTPVAGTTGTTNVLTVGEIIYFATFVNATTTTLTLPTSPVLGDNFYVWINGANGTATLTTSATVYRVGDSSSGTVLTPNQVAAANAKHKLTFTYDGSNWWYNDTFSSLALVNNTTATTQAIGDASTLVATDSFADRTANSVPTVDATSNHTLALADGYPGSNLISMTSGSANTVTIPLNASVAFPIGRWIFVTQSGTGATTLVATGGVTINSNGSLLTLPGQNTTVALNKTGTDTWSAYGTGSIVTYPATVPINTFLYASAANVISATAATINNAVIITGAGGIPGPSTTLPSAITIPAPVFSTGATASGSTAFNLSGSTGAFIPSQTGGITGTTTNNSVNAGGVGEIVTSAVASGAAVSLTTATAANMTSISLTAGDWDVEANVNLTAASATVTAMQGGLSSTSATLPTDGTEAFSGVLLTVSSSTDTITLPRKRFSLSGTTTIYAVAKVTFSAGTDVAFGSMTARRVR